MPDLLNVAAHNGAEPAEPESEEDRNRWLQGDLDLAEQRKQRMGERSKAALAFYQGQDDSPGTAKTSQVSSAHPTKSDKAGQHKGEQQAPKRDH